MDWFRTHHNITNDPKLGIIARKCKQPKAFINAVWFCILDYASQQEDRGSLKGMDAELIAYTQEIDEDIVESILQVLSEKGRIKDNRIVNWEKRQPEREDTTSTERKRKQRAKEKEQSQTKVVTECDKVDSHAPSHNVTQCHGDVTDGHTMSHNVTTDKIRGDKIREEEIVHSSNHLNLKQPFVQNEFGREPEKDNFEKNKVEEDFNQFWQSYPKREGRKKAKAVFERIIWRKEATVERIISGAAKYAESVKDKDPQYIKQPDNWLNGGHWSDYEENTAAPPEPPPFDFEKHISQLDSKWRNVAIKLRDSVGDSTYRSWFLGIKLEEIKGGSQLIVTVDSMFKRDQLITKYHEELQKAIKSAYGKNAGYEVRLRGKNGAN